MNAMHFYDGPAAGWLGWITDGAGTCTAFVGTDGTIHPWDQETLTLS